MEFNNVIENRASIRKMSNKQISDEMLEELLSVTLKAPTAKNNQPQRILAIRSEEGLKKIDEASPCRFNAPLVLIVCYDENEEATNTYDDNMGYGMIDASIVLTYIMLKSVELGLSNTWVGYYKNEVLRKNFNIPDNYKIVSIMPIGYKEEDATASRLHLERFPLEHTVSYETY